MKRDYQLILAFILSVLVSTVSFRHAHANASDSSTFNAEPSITSQEKIGAVRTFESLNHYIDAAALVETDIFSSSAYEDTTITGTIAKFRSRAQAIFDEVRAARRYVDFLDETSLLELPVGINKTIGNIDYTIIVDSITLRPDGA